MSENKKFRVNVSITITRQFDVDNLTTELDEAIKADGFDPYDAEISTVEHLGNKDESEE